MNIKYSLKISTRALRVNKSRSFLTILGIVIGITAIMLVMAIGQGAQSLIIGQIQGMGSKTLVIVPGREPKGPMDMSAMGTLFAESLKERELNALLKKTNVPTLGKIMPVVFGTDGAAYGSETYQLTIFGGTEELFDLYDLTPGSGNFFTNEDVRGRSDVVVLGAKVKTELFGESQAVGENIKIKGRNFRVVGLLEQKGSGSLLNFDESAFIPYTTAQQYIFGIKHFNRLVVEADNEKDIAQTVQDIQITLRNLHNITDPEKDDFFIETQADLVDRVGVVTNVLTAFLAAVAAISLLVGGVGIMNIMMVSVTERTREIGLRKALGATRKDILVQFLFEAMLLTGSGGFIGVSLGALFSFLSALILSNVLGLNWAFVFPIKAMLLGLGVATLVGLIFGLYPARKASQKSPIEALRYE